MQTFKLPLPEHPDHPGVEQWAELRAASEIRSGDLKALRKATVMSVGKDGEWDRTFTVGDPDAQTDALLIRLIVSWSYDLPLPVADAGSLDELPIEAWEAFREAIKPHREALDFRGRAASQKPTPGDSSDSRTISEESESPDTSPTTS